MMSELHAIREKHYQKTKTAPATERNRLVRFLSSYGYRLVPTKRGTRKLVRRSKWSAESVDASDILDRSDMERPRSPSELFAWVTAKCDELGATPEAKAFARSGALLPKKFYEEVYPLALFAQHEFGGRDAVLVQPNFDNDNFDGRITVGTGAVRKKTIFVEVTSAKDGHDESRRMEVLGRRGHVSLTGPVFSSGRKGSPNRRVHVKMKAVRHLAVLEDYLAIVKARLEDKARSRYGKDHTLVVVVDDYLPLRESSDVNRLRKAAASWLPELRLDFGRVVFLGIAGNLFLSFDVW